MKEYEQNRVSGLVAALNSLRKFANRGGGGGVTGRTPGVPFAT